jgi:MFS family permease
MYLNRYLFHLVESADMVPIMVACSAVAATLTTLLMGALSDRLGKRKLFISFGYIIWGVAILLFPLARVIKDTGAGQAVEIATHYAMLSGVFIVVMDCLMTFFGSTANDACFNAYVTDSTNTKNRGKVESVLSILPLVSMLVIFGGMEGIIASETFDGWLVFFIIIGALTVIAGIVNIFIMPKENLQPNKDEPYIKNIFYGFRPKVIKSNKMLYICLAAFMLFSIAIQVFFPYFMIYIEHGLKITGFDFILTLGIVLIISCIITVVFGIFMDKIGKSIIMIPALGVTIVGAILMFFLKDQIGVMIGGTILMSGYMVSTAVLNAKIRDYTPEKEVGLFQGIRMIFSVCVPMVTGPFIGTALYEATTTNKYINQYGVEETIPNEFIFLGAAAILVLAIVPLIFIILKERKTKTEIVKNED